MTFGAFLVVTVTVTISVEVNVSKIVSVTAIASVNVRVGNCDCELDRELDRYRDANTHVTLTSRSLHADINERFFVNFFILFDKYHKYL